MSTEYAHIRLIIHHMFLHQDVKILIEDIAALKPTVFCAVPRVLERIYTGKYFARQVNVLKYIEVISS